ncbi:hypothetical protein ALQ18_03316 [Pseudomonas marginalis pv. marginalis]|uniref:DUF6572 domain-containing protein n=1 Tax=Pseudomonas sp. ICMP 460 TaxID=1718917 RepID=UPI000C07A43E|nr:DUF6572 domain-containing protein [Pseudomonas sp. ICMP 460]PHN33036.1 hypothetical protein AO240_02265 [Pseudomonas sp. ICMP 460]RMP62750.1 hypothetical protein ALQ18_03316 [Pseudomonas marginalis pv. marginalis]
MSVTDANVIDMLGIPKLDDSTIILAITDHLGWANPTEQGEHLLMLQAKINAYVAFIESGEIYTEVPGALGKYPIIQVAALYELSEQGERFIKQATAVLEPLGIGLEFEYNGDKEQFAAFRT